MNGYNELISAIEYQKKLSHQYLDELSRLRPDRHKIEDIVNADKNYTMHTYCYNQLMLLKDHIDSQNKVKISIESIDSITKNIISIIVENSNNDNINESTRIDSLKLSGSVYTIILNKIQDYYNIEIYENDIDSWITIMDIVSTVIHNI